MYAKCQDKTVGIVLTSLLLTFLTPLTSHGIWAVPDYDRNPAAYSVSTVVIDAGHGGKDPGCLGSHSREKDIALQIALLLGEEINQAFPDVNVIYTRTTDVFIPLHERARIANKAQADLFISIHCNTAGKRNQAFGTETFIMGLHRAKENLEVAKRENSAILHEDDYAEHYDGYDPDSPEGHILLSMYQNAYLEQSIALAHAVETEFTNVDKRKSRGVKQAGFLVLRKTTMPSILVEAGFLSSDDEENYLSSGEGQKEAAQSIFRAFSRYKNEVEGAGKALDVAESNASVNTPLTADTTRTIGERYYVQLFATKQLLPADDVLFRKVPNLTARQDAEFYKYLAGPFETLPEASSAKDALKQDGFDGAFVVSYRGDARININEDTVSKED